MPIRRKKWILFKLKYKAENIKIYENDIKN